MNAKLWIVIFGTAFAVFIFHHALRAEEKSSGGASNVFLDEGEADYEMPRVEIDKLPEAAPENKVSAKKSKGKDSKKPRVPATNEEDDDQAATGTKGDAFDQMQNPEAAQAPAAEKKTPAKVLKKSEDMSKAENPDGKMATNTEVVPTEEPPAAELQVKMKPKPKQEAERGSASVQFKQGFKTTNGGDCVMYADTDKASPQILVVKGAKKLWVEQTGDWYKAFHKKGSGFLSQECFQ